MTAGAHPSSDCITIVLGVIVRNMDPLLQTLELLLLDLEIGMGKGKITRSDKPTMLQLRKNVFFFQLKNGYN